MCAVFLACTPGQLQAADPSWLMDPITGPNLSYKTFYSATAGTNVSYVLFQPPGYDTELSRRYPVVYWLHGVGGAQTGVPTMAQRLIDAINADKTPPMLFVFVNGMVNSFYNNDIYPVETVSITELIPHIDATYRTIATRAGRMVEGFSMGGNGAGYWGFKYTELFGSVSILAGASLSGAPTAQINANQNAVRGRTTVRIAVGEADGLLGGNTTFHQLLDSLGIAHGFTTHPGVIHSPNPIYDALGEANWPFYTEAFGNAFTAASSWQEYAR